MNATDSSILEELSSETSESELDSSQGFSRSIFVDSSDDTTPSSRKRSITPTSRQGRRLKRRKTYLVGSSRTAYRFSPTLENSIQATEDMSSQSSLSSDISSDWNTNVCESCSPVLKKYAAILKGLTRQGSELKRRKKSNPHPKRPNTKPYRDLVKQNEWLHSNIFDCIDNYLFCCKCVHHGLGISYQRLARQRNVKK